jgi:hypothetical protein
MALRCLQFLLSHFFIIDHSYQARAAMEEMVTLLEDYISLLQEIDNASAGAGEKPSSNYLMPSFTVSPDEWAEFENVYQIHCPTIHMNIVIRDVRLLYLFRSFKSHLEIRS